MLTERSQTPKVTCYIYAFFYMKYPKETNLQRQNADVVSGGVGAGVMESQYLMGMEFLSEMIKVF